jgi:hypothetical protein
LQLKDSIELIEGFYNMQNPASSEAVAQLLLKTIIGKK